MKNKLIIYQAEIEFTDKDGKHIRVSTSASSASELNKNISEILDKKSKNFIERLF